MNNKKLKVYVGGGWFSKNQEEVLTSLEDTMRTHPEVEPYFPRHDGVKLTPDQLHDSNLRRSIFEDNITHIRNADLVVAACDGRDGFYDTGTQWELGYAMANNIPVIAYDTTDNIYNSMKSLIRGFYAVCHEIETLSDIISHIAHDNMNVIHRAPQKILFIGPSNTESQQEVNKDIVSSVILECHGSNFRWVDDLSLESIYDSIEDIFQDVDYMISVIDDRHPVVSWFMGQAYSREIPVITYTNFDYGVNIMLLMSLLYHCKGKEELRRVMQTVKRDGLYSLPKFDDSATKAM